jgi:hypothetical protein
LMGKMQLRAASAAFGSVKDVEGKSHRMIIMVGVWRPRRGVLANSPGRVLPDAVVPGAEDAA